MDAGKLIGIILEARKRAQSIASYYVGKPYTATIVSCLDGEVHRSIEDLNYELRDELGIGLYIDVIPTIADTTVQGYIKVRKIIEDRR